MGMNPWGIIVLIAVVRVIEALMLAQTPAVTVFDFGAIFDGIFSFPPDFGPLVDFLGFVLFGFVGGMPAPLNALIILATTGPLVYAVVQLIRGV